MNYSFHPEAEEEFNKAIDYYENISAGLGYDFALEVYETVQRVVAFPYAWAILEREIRRCLVRRFPFGILYIQNSGSIVIIAVMNLHRKPDYWKQRGV